MQHELDSSALELFLLTHFQICQLYLAMFFSIAKNSSCSLPMLVSLDPRLVLVNLIKDSMGSIPVDQSVVTGT